MLARRDKRQLSAGLGHAHRVVHNVGSTDGATGAVGATAWATALLVAPSDVKHLLEQVSLARFDHTINPALVRRVKVRLRSIRDQHLGSLELRELYQDIANHAGNNHNDFVVCPNIRNPDLGAAHVSQVNERSAAVTD